METAHQRSTCTSSRPLPSLMEHWSLKSAPMYLVHINNNYYKQMIFDIMMSRGRGHSPSSPSPPRFSPPRPEIFLTKTSPNANGRGKSSLGVCRGSERQVSGRLDRARPAYARRSSSSRRNKPLPPPLASSPSPRPGTMASSPRTAVARSDAECAVREAKTSCRVGPSAKDRVKTR